MIPIKTDRYRLKIFRLPNGKSPYLEWMASLDLKSKATISARISRFEDGYFGDSKALNSGLYEARFFIGPGYRVYFSVQGDEVILLLTGGDKASQSKDILKAKKYLKIFLEGGNDANKKL